MTFDPLRKAKETDSRTKFAQHTALHDRLLDAFFSQAVLEVNNLTMPLAVISETKH